MNRVVSKSVFYQGAVDWLYRSAAGEWMGDWALVEIIELNGVGPPSTVTARRPA